MNSSRLLRAIITGLTLLAVLYGLHLLSLRRAEGPVMAHVSKSPRAEELKSPKAEKQKAKSEKQKIEDYPFAAMGDCCLDGVETDLSGCTRKLSGGKAKEYLLHARAGQNLRISVEPLYEQFDVSFVLKHGDECLIGRDAGRKGQTERATISNLAAGDYTLWVGGYDDDCGPYLLTIEDQPPTLAQIQGTSILEGRNGTVLRWKSFGECDIAQYQIYRVMGSLRERIAVLRAHGSPAGFSDYRFMDRGRIPGAGYELEMVAGDGRSERVAVNS